MAKHKLHVEFVERVVYSVELEVTLSAEDEAKLEEFAGSDQAKRDLMLEGYLDDQHPSWFDLAQAQEGWSGHGHQAAEGQLPGPGEGGEERRGRRRRGLDGRQHERDQDDRYQGEHQAGPQRHVGPDRCRHQEDRRIDQVELLLDGQGPEVLERRRRQGGVQVVGADTSEMEVGQEQRRPPGSYRRRVAVKGAEGDVGGDHRDHDHQGGGWKDAPDPSAIEGNERGARRRRPLP